MKHLFEPAVRLMNRLKYVYKFAIIGLLIIIQAAGLIYMLVSELNKNIDFTMRERIGVQYSQALIPLFDEGQAYRRIHYAYLHGDHSLAGQVLSQQVKVDEALEALMAVDSQIAGSLDCTWKLKMLQQDWQTRKQAAAPAAGQQAQVEFDLDSRWLNEVTDLLQQVGYASNLAMDSDFSTSYLVDSVLRKMPGLLDALGSAQSLSIQLSDEQLSPESRNHLLQLVGLVRSSLEQADHNLQQIFRHDENIKNDLKTINTAITDGVPIFNWNLEQKTIGQQGLPIPQSLLTGTGNQAINSAADLHKQELAVIDQLLLLRIDRYLQYRNAVIIFTGSILLIVCYLFAGFDISVRKGVYQLARVMACVSKGNLDARGRIYSRDEMGSLTHSINNMLDSLQKMVEEVQSSRAQLEIWNQQLEQKVAERTVALRNLLDHAGQGFLSFGEDLCISKEYSAECAVIFQRDIADEKVSALIYPDDLDQQAFLTAVFGKILQEKNEFLRETYFSLLPEEIVFGDRYVGVTYKMINNANNSHEGRIMLILTDQTLRKNIEDQVQAERDVLAMIVYVVTHSADFFAAVSQYTAFCQTGLTELLQEKKSAKEILTALFRTIHTFKGTFGQLRMGNVMAKLHDMEGRLDTIRAHDIAGLTGVQLTDKLRLFTEETMLDWLNEDLTILNNKLGESFFQRKNTLIVDNDRLLEIETKIQNVLSPGESWLLLADLHRLRYKPIRDLLQSYPEYVCSLAERHEKAVKPFEIEGGTTFVDPEKYYDFVKSLGHIFRNSIVHGLETFDERLAQNKDASGIITCTINENEGGLILAITDDGRGMDPERIRDIAVEKGLCSLSDVQDLSGEECLQFVFADGFSGAAVVDELAGRGVGLSAVRAELEKLGGSVQIQTRIGKGTTFQFFLPLTITSDNQRYSIRQLAKPLLNSVENYLKQQADLQVTHLTYIEGGDGGKINLRKVSTFLAVKGISAGKIVLSADQEVVEHLLAKAGSREGVLERRMENILAQYAQAIFQQAVDELSSGAGLITAEALLSILAEDASAKYPQAETSSWILDTVLGSITLSLIY